MKKIFLKTFIVAVASVLLQQPKAAAQQTYCPIGLLNNANIVALTNQTLYNTFVPDLYRVNFVYDQLFPCAFVDAELQVNKSNNIGAVLGGTTTGGVGIYIDLSSQLGCLLPNNTTNNGLQNGGVSVYITNAQTGDLVFSIDYTMGGADQCFYPPLPVTWGYFNINLLTSPLRVPLTWQSTTEDQVDHFSVEKSYDGISWHKIAHIAATGGTTTIPQNYAYTDYNVADRNFYRIVAVDIDCSRDVSLVRWVRCPGNEPNACPPAYGIPNIPQDCTPPPSLPYLSGPTAICDNAMKLYKLNLLYGNATVTWSFDAPYLATIKPVSHKVVVTPTGNSGIGTLTATVVKNGITTYYNYSIVFGIPSLYGWCSSTSPDNCNGFTDFTATVSMLPGTSPWQYEWYSNGYYIGSGGSHTWYNIWPGQIVYFTVTYNGPCGQSTWTGSTMGCYMEAKTATRPKLAQYKIAPNPAKSDISIQRIPPCEEPPGPVEPQWKTRSAGVSALNSQAITIKVFDAQGRLRKTSKVSANSTKLSINGSDLPAGLYFVHITEEGKETVTLKVLLEK